MTHALRTPSHNESEARQIASRQFGLIEHQQARKLLSDAAIGRRLKAKLWERVMPRVYRIVGAPASEKQSAMAAVLWAGDDALVSHGTAATLWDFVAARGQKPELWLPGNRGVRSSEVRVHRGKRLDRADSTLLGPIPITTPVRTLIDIAGRLEDDRLLAVTEDVFRRNLATPDRVYARLRALRASGRPGGGRLEALLDARGDGRPLESNLEALAWPIICSSGVPLPARQHWVILPGGRYRLDFAWPEFKIGLECEGHAFHGNRSAWGKDRARYAEFVAAGWRVLPLTWDACSRDPRRVARWIKAALENAA